MLLKVSNLTVSYDKAMVINDISMHVKEGELVSLVGPNGAGKSTLLRAITGLVRWDKEVKRGTREGDISLKGTVTFDGERIEKLPAHDIVKRGLIHCPERRRPFRELDREVELTLREGRDQVETEARDHPHGTRESQQGDRQNHRARAQRAPQKSRIVVGQNRHPLVERGGYRQ